jgi:CheY-like chemotaxis protein
MKPPAKPRPIRARVACVDDEPMILVSLRRVLGREHDVLVLSRGVELVERLREGQRFDVIVSDLMMPELNGMDLFERVTEIDPEQARRMVYITGGAFTAAAQAFLERVPNPRLAKPFDPVALRALIRTVATSR